MISISICGDIVFDKRAGKLCDKKHYKKLFGDTLDIFKNSDIVIGNLEAPIIETIDEIFKTGPNLLSSKNTLDALSYANFNILTLANNHILDHNDSGLKNTLNLCKNAGIKYVGAGENLSEAKKILIKEIKGKKIAFVNVCEFEFSIASEMTAGANPINEIDLFYQIKEIKNNCDVSILIIHGGIEFHNLPSPDLKKKSRFYIDLGFDSVIYHHSHNVAGYEIYNSKPIFYGIGNFIFDRENKNKDWHRGIIVNLIINKNNSIDYQIYPYNQFDNLSTVQLLGLKEKKEVLADLESKQKKIKNDKYIEKKWNDFCERNKINYFHYLFNINKVKRFLIRRKLFKKQILKKEHLLLAINMFRCQSHLEVTKTILKNELKTIEGFKN